MNGRNVFLLRTVEPRLNKWYKVASDHSLHTETILEIVEQTINGKKRPALHVSVRAWIHYQPFAGFFKTRKLPRTTPPICDVICQIDDIEITFAPRSVSRDEYEQHAEYRRFRPLHYPVMRTYSRVCDSTSLQGFAGHMRDPFRPIPIVVFFGDTVANRREAAYLANACWTKCRIWLLREDVHGLKELLEECIKGINVSRDFRWRYCRVFFPVGQYLQEDMAQPTYWVPILNRHHFHKRMKIGLMRFFSLDSCGWITSAEDLAWAQYDDSIRNRIDKSDARAQMNEAIISQLRAERNSARKRSETADVRLDQANYEIESIRKDMSSLQSSSEEILIESASAIDERDRLIEENANLKNRLLILRGQSVQENRPIAQEKFRLSLDDAPDNFDTLVWCVGRLFPHLAIAPEAWDNMERKNNAARFVKELWRMFWCLDKTLHEMLFVNPVPNAEMAFLEKTGYGIHGV